MPNQSNVILGGASSTSIPQVDLKSEQYLRKSQLLVYQTGAEQAIDLSNLRFKFSVKQSDAETPNNADIRVYNLNQDIANAIFQNMSPNMSVPTDARGQVLLQAGYEGNYGVIFQGNIKQILVGRESATDTYVDIVAGDGDRAYNFAVVNTSIKKGSTAMDQIKALTATTAPQGVTAGHLGTMPPNQLARGKVMYGNSRNFIRQIAKSTGNVWSIQNQQVTFVPQKGYLPNQRVILTSKTGLIGTPQQTNTGVNVKCLLNPLLRIGGLIDISNATVDGFKINFAVPGSPANLPALPSADGVYYNLVIDHEGDTRGIPWYSTIVGITTHVGFQGGATVTVSGGA